jgi:type IV secretion system protein VirD4
MDKLLLGRRWNPRSGRIGRRVTYNQRSHTTLIAPTGAGKGVTLELPNALLGLRRMSLLSIDPSGQNAAVCADARRGMLHQTTMLNPFNLHVERYPDMADVGFNPVAALPKADAPNFFSEAMALGDAAISVEGDSQIHFPNSARGLMTWIMMFVRLIEGEQGNLGTVRDILTGDLPGAAQAAVATGHPRIKSLAYKYTEELSRELQGVVSTAETQTRWLLDDNMRASLSKNNSIDFAQLADNLISCFLILPPEQIETHGAWLRIVVTCALNALYRRGGAGRVPVLMLLSEFAQLGKVAPIRAAFGQARKYNLRLFPVLQNWGQLVDLYGEKGAWTFIGNSGCVIGLNPGNDADTAEFFSRLSDEHGEVGVNASPDPRAPGGLHISYTEQRERVWSPGEIRQIPDFHGLVWKAGQSQPTPVYCAPYWTSAACRRVARPDPFHETSAARSSVRWAVRAGAVALLAGIAALMMGFG